MAAATFAKMTPEAAQLASTMMPGLTNLIPTGPNQSNPLQMQIQQLQQMQMQNPGMMPPLGPMGALGMPSQGLNPLITPGELPMVRRVAIIILFLIKGLIILSEICSQYVTLPGHGQPEHHGEGRNGVKTA